MYQGTCGKQRLLIGQLTNSQIRLQLLVKTQHPTTAATTNLNAVFKHEQHCYSLKIYNPFILFSESNRTIDIQPDRLWFSPLLFIFYSH